MVAVVVVGVAGMALRQSGEREQGSDHPVQTQSQRQGSIADAHLALKLNPEQFDIGTNLQKGSPGRRRLSKICLEGVEYLYLSGAQAAGLQANVRMTERGLPTVQVCGSGMHYPSEIPGRLHQICLEGQTHYYLMASKSASLALKYKTDGKAESCNTNDKESY